MKAAIHKKTQKRVAIKIIKKSSANNTEMGLIRSEIETLKVCQHPNIIRLLDVFENADSLYLVTELLAGGNLYGYMEGCKFAVSETRARRIVHSLATALFYLHSYGIVHRDLKPANVMMTNKTEHADVKIVDFGLAKLIGPSQFCTEVSGTLAYMAPEVLQQKPYGKAVDIWSLGVITYFLLVGRLPFDHKDSAVLTMYWLDVRVG